jgi:hypothetical protein
MTAAQFIKENYTLTNGGKDYICNHSGQLVGAEDIAEEYHQAKLKSLSIADVSGSAYRYPMTQDQPCQIDCRVTGCKFSNGSGKCENVSPAITLNENGKFVCWSQADR